MYAAAASSTDIGSAEHREILARFFLESHLDYVPEAMHWPVLPEAERARLAALPFWQEAVSTESVTSNTVSAAADLEFDPEIRRAIEMQGFEEKRHARLLVELTNAYRIKIETPPTFVSDTVENDFLSAGFGECFDSFFAFGLFALARESGFFTTALVDTFEPVIQEEARHILFFVNWVQYRRSQLPWWKRVAFRLRCARIIVKHVLSRIKTARTIGGGTSDTEENFTMSAHQELGQGITLNKLLALCLSENERRLAGYDARLRRPRLVPTLARFLYRVLPASL
jgi:hypothetical protein